MEDKMIFNIFKIWLISLLSFDILLIFTIYILGNYTEYDLPDFLGNVTALIALVSGFAGITSVIYAITKKEKNQILIGIGIIFFSLILLLFSVVLAIATIY